ncbi:MAG: hypothetical protein ABWW69_05410 [Pyrodictiaceae archaeon]
MEDEELERILREKALSFLKKAKEGDKKEYYVEKVTASSRNGVYVYEPSKRMWRLLREEGEAFKLGELGPGVYVVYFDNTLCKACRLYDNYWYSFIDKYGDASGTYYVIVLCDWFTIKCSSEAAKKSFKEYSIKASPTTIVALVEDSKIVYREVYEGVLSFEELERTVLGFRDRARKALGGAVV